MDFTIFLAPILTGLVAGAVVVGVIKNELKHVWKGIERLDREDSKIWTYIGKHLN